MIKTAKSGEKKLQDKSEKVLGKQEIECYESTLVDIVVFQCHHDNDSYFERGGKDHEKGKGKESIQGLD